MIKMKFEISELGNRVIIKTLKKNEVTKITPLVYENALKTIMKLKKNDCKIELNGEMSDYRIKSLF